MKYVISISVLVLMGCASNPNKAVSIDTRMDKQQPVSGDGSIGVKEGNLVFQRKVLMSEELRSLQIEVYELEDHVYGSAKFGSLGIYGVLKTCRRDLASKDNGGDGKLSFTETMDRVTDKETEFKIGYDEHDQLVGISEEFLKDRMTRFQGYRKVLQGREAELEQKVDICRLALKSNQYDLTAKTDR